MEYTFKYIRRTRALFIDLVNSLTLEQLNEVPKGFNNNIVWNFGHIVVSTLGLCYVRSGVEPTMQIQDFNKYKNGSKPESFITKEEVEALKEHAIQSIQQIEEDIKANKFNNIVPYATQTFGYNMSTIEEIVTCTQSHDAIHFGVALAIKKTLQ
jgi:hypothetical protein